MIYLSQNWHFLEENICVYSLEAPQWGASNEYHNICFIREIRKYMFETYIFLFL